MKTFVTVMAILCLNFSLLSQSTADEKAIQQVLETMTEGWTNGDGKQFASVFTDTHDFIVWNGFYFKNMNTEQNAVNHQGIFNTMYKDTRLYYVLDKIKFIREDIALIHVLGAVAPKGESRPKDPGVLWTAILEKSEENWRILSFHNLDLEVYENDQFRENAPIPAEVMYSSWYEAR